MANSKAVSFPLRLSWSIREQAVEFARREGISLNQFVALAVVEKMTRVEQSAKSQKVKSIERVGWSSFRGGRR